MSLAFITGDRKRTAEGVLLAAEIDLPCPHVALMYLLYEAPPDKSIHWQQLKTNHVLSSL